MQGRVSPDQQSLDLKVRATLSDGSILVQDLRIDLITGAMTALQQRRSDYVPLFNEQIRKFASFNDGGAHALAAALDEAGYDQH